MCSKWKRYSINSIKIYRGWEFDKKDISTFCVENGFGYNFLTPKTPQQNGVAEKNRSLQEMARTMLNEFSLPQIFLPRLLVLHFM